MNPPTCPAPVMFRTGSRLHCGLFSDPRPSGLAFQGFGLMIDSPGYQISASVVTDDQLGHRIEANSDIRQRIEKSLDTLTQDFGSDASQLLDIRVEESLPQHCGFGSGTQLALVIGRIWAWFNQPDLTTAQIAQALNRGQRSCIGTFGFDQGGLLIDRGFASGEKVGQSRYQTSLPDSWRILLIRPLGVQGVSGQNETRAFEQLPDLAIGQVEQLQDLLEVIETQSDCFQAFSEALREYGMIVGESFASVQSGCFTAPICHEIFEFLTANGLQGVAQSSWGPTMFGVCETSKQAESLLGLISENFSKVEVSVARIQNSGCKIVQDSSSSTGTGELLT